MSWNLGQNKYAGHTNSLQTFTLFRLSFTTIVPAFRGDSSTCHHSSRIHTNLWKQKPSACTQPPTPASLGSLPTCLRLDVSAGDGRRLSVNTGRALAPRVRKIREPQSWPQKNKANTNFRRVGRYLGVLEKVAECCGAEPSSCLKVKHSQLSVRLVQKENKQAQMLLVVPENVHCG